METTFSTNRKQFLQDYKNLLLSNGFRVLEPTEGDKTYFFFEKGGKVAYVQNGDFYGLSFGSAHKPSKDIGTGYGFKRDVSEPTVQDAEECLNFKGFGKLTHKAIKYSSLEDYLKEPINQIVKKQIIEPS